MGSNPAGVEDPNVDFEEGGCAGNIKNKDVRELIHVDVICDFVRLLSRRSMVLSQS